MGADLELDRFDVRPQHGGVQRLVEVELRHRDVVLEPARQRVPASVQHAQRGVAVPLMVDQDAQPDQVVDLEEVAAPDDHLLIDRVVVLRPAVDRGLDLRGRQVVLHLVDHLAQIVLAQRRPGRDHAHDLVVHLGVQGGEGEVLQLPLDRVHAQPVGQRREDLQGLVGDHDLLVLPQEAERAHVVQPVGELDHQHPDVAAHRQHHLADGLGLGGLPVGDLVELGHPVDHRGHLGAEVGGQLRHRVRGVLDRVVQQRRAQRGLGQAQLGQDRRHRQRVGDERIAALAGLAGVVVLGRPVGPFDQRDVGPGMVRPQRLDQRIQHRGLAVLRCPEPGQRMPHAHPRLVTGAGGTGQRMGLPG